MFRARDSEATCRAAVLAGLIGLLLGAGGWVRAGSMQGVSLAIGRGWATVREMRVVTVAQGEQDLVFDEIPEEADLSSLMLRANRVSLELLDWNWMTPSPESSALVRTAGSVVWKPGQEKEGGANAVEGLRSVRCRVRTAVASQDVPVEMVYRVRGPAWAAKYEAAVRGEQSEEKEPVSVDLSGLVRITNPTQKSFAEATIVLVGAEDPPARDPRSDPGILALDEDSPLADLWREPPPEAQTEFEYSLPRPVSLGAHSETDVSIIRTMRTPASRIYSMVSEDLQLGGSAVGEPLRKWIVFQNVAANRMGQALPPGRVQVFLGGMRTHLLQEARFRRTPENGEIRIDLGRAEDVRGARSSRGRTPTAGGVFQEGFSLAIRNLRDADVVVEIDEKPSVNLEWTLISATKSCREVFRRLQFATEVKARSTETVEYQLRVRQPEL